MAGSARYTAVLDANVLYPAMLRDVLLSLADADLYSAKWSVHIREGGRAACCGTGPAWESRLPLLRKPWRTLFRTASSLATNT